jgi:hypothetical protein
MRGNKLFEINSCTAGIYITGKQDSSVLLAALTTTLATTSDDENYDDDKQTARCYDANNDSH